MREASAAVRCRSRSSGALRKTRRRSVTASVTRSDGGYSFDFMRCSPPPAPTDVRAHLEAVVARWQQLGELRQHALAVLTAGYPAHRRREGEHALTVADLLVHDLRAANVAERTAGDEVLWIGGRRRS